MREFVVFIWMIIALILGFILMYFSKKLNRKLGKYAMIYKIILVLCSFIISFFVYKFVDSAHHLVWVTRLSIFALGALNVFILYKRPWTIRDDTNYEEDSFSLEFLFVLISSFTVLIAFVSCPQVCGIIEYRVDVSKTLWEAPILFFFPFLIFKMIDFGGQVPFKTIENPYIFPVEPVVASEWPWRDLVQINFQLKKNLNEEYNLFTWNSRPWIEAPKEVSLGNIFQLCIQERRKRKDMMTIQDLGDEYHGTPEFCWLFYIKKKWYNPITWFGAYKYLNPDLSIEKNNIMKGDIILAKRIPGDGSKRFRTDYHEPFEYDDMKTVIIKR